MKFETSTLAERKEMLGESLYCQIKEMYSNSELVSKLTGMLLEMDDIDLLHMLKHDKSLKSKVQEAVQALEELSKAQNAIQDLDDQGYL